MSHHPVLRVLKFLFVVVFASIVLGFIVKALWNVLVPGIFGWHTITYWQALGLLFLSRILFGGFHRHGGGGRNRWKRHLQKRWETMTPEERERFRRGVRCGRGPFTAPEESGI